MTQLTRSTQTWQGFMVVLLAMMGASGLMALGGCRGAANQGDQKTPEVPRLVSGRLPELGDYLPPLDDGRLELAPPKDWVVAPRSSEYIVRFQAEAGSTYPSVLVEANPSERFKTVTPENLEAFAKSVAAELEAAGAKTTVKMGRLGNLNGVTYTRRAKVKGDFGGIVERLFFDTVVGERRYKFELRCPPEMVTLAEPYFFAIVNGAKLTSVTELQEETLVEKGSGSPPGQKEMPEAQAEQKTVKPATAAPEKAQTQAKDEKPAATGTAAGQVTSGTQPQSGKSPPASGKETESGEKSAPQAAKPEAKEPENPAPKVESPANPSQEGKSEEKPTRKKTEDLLKEVDSLLQ